MADSHWKSANRMVDRLVAKHGEHPQTWLLRVSIRMCTSQLLGAIDDCKHLLSFDRDCYRACVFLGQSYWWMQRLEVASKADLSELVGIRDRVDFLRTKPLGSESQA
jgi:hypothetical protein